MPDQPRRQFFCGIVEQLVGGVVPGGFGVELIGERFEVGVAAGHPDRSQAGENGQVGTHIVGEAETRRHRNPRRHVQHPPGQRVAQRPFHRSGDNYLCLPASGTGRRVGEPGIAGIVTGDHDHVERTHPRRHRFGLDQWDVDVGRGQCQNQGRSSPGRPGATDDHHGPWP